MNTEKEELNLFGRKLNSVELRLITRFKGTGKYSSSRTTGQGSLYMTIMTRENRVTSLRMNSGTDSKFLDL